MFLVVNYGNHLKTNATINYTTYIQTDAHRRKKKKKWKNKKKR